MPAPSPSLFFLAASATSLMLALLPSNDPVGPVVQTVQGRVRGTFDTSHDGRRYLAFYNMPYAKPPVGQLRFRSPQPPDSWADIRDARAPGPSCPQNKLMGFNENEDCLYLNVFTPELNPAKLRPVMVWIYGGAWITGTSRGYEAGYLIDKDVVIVTFNYRLGILGFLSTDDENSPGNYGLKDQVAALKWVRDNIHAFGGNPADVTIFGSSSGGASVHYHMLSPASKGLFHKAISESGVALDIWARPKPGLATARKVAALLRCPTEPSAALVDCLRGVKQFWLTLTQFRFMEWFFCPSPPFRPVVEEQGEDSFLPDSPQNLKPHTYIPWLVGVNAGEGALFSGAFVVNKRMLQKLDQKRERLFPVCFDYQTSPQASLITERIRNFYFSSGEPSVSGATDMISDALFTWKTDVSIRKFKGTAAIYYYLFSYKGEYSLTQIYGKRVKNIGISHGDELIYLFPKNPYFNIAGELPPKDMETVKKLTKLWTDFAKTGNPTPDNDPVHWPQVTSDGELEYMDIGETLEVKQGLFKERIDFWKSLPFCNTTRRACDKEL